MRVSAANNGGSDLTVPAFQYTGRPPIGRRTESTYCFCCAPRPVSRVRRAAGGFLASAGFSAYNEWSSAITSLKHRAVSSHHPTCLILQSVNRPNVFFRLVVLACGLFIVTVLAMTASVFSKPGSPLPRLLDEFGLALIVWEVTAILALGFLALAVDRTQSRRRAAANKHASPESRSPSTPSFSDDD